MEKALNCWLHPHQDEEPSQGGCETITYKVLSLIANAKVSEDIVLPQLDSHNASNRVLRDTVCVKMREHFPELLC